VKLSDILREAPSSVHRALAHILVAKLFRKAVNERFEDVYRNYAYRPEVIRANEQAQRNRGRKRILGPQGRVRDLEKAFKRLNRQYFDGKLKMPRLTWSVHRTRNILGHLDHVHNTLVISRTLDDLRVPEYFYDYILYHEMLHLKHPRRRVGDKCHYHTQAFLRDEQKFKYYHQAQDWLRKAVARWQ
jgi:predicted metal-dependent hydrolase